MQRRTVEAKNAKSKRKDTVPISSVLVETLKEWREHRTKEFGRAPLESERVVRVPRHINEQLRKDCAFANIPTKNGRNETLDFYAATRHTFCTNLARAKMSPHTQRQLMRHTDLKVTQVYTHLEMSDLVEGIESVKFKSENRAKLMPNQGRTEAHGGSSGCNEPGANNRAGNEVKSDGVQELASSGTTLQEFSRTLDKVAEKWRRRESNPRPEILLIGLLRV